jgi:hypothetical protein
MSRLELSAGSLPALSALEDPGHDQSEMYFVSPSSRGVTTEKVYNPDAGTVDVVKHSAIHGKDGAVAALMQYACHVDPVIRVAAAAALVELFTKAPSTVREMARTFLAIRDRHPWLNSTVANQREEAERSYPGIAFIAFMVAACEKKYQQTGEPYGRALEVLAAPKPGTKCAPGDRTVAEGVVRNFVAGTVSTEDLKKVLDPDIAAKVKEAIGCSAKAAAANGNVSIDHGRENAGELDSVGARHIENTAVVDRVVVAGIAQGAASPIDALPTSALTTSERPDPMPPTDITQLLGQACGRSAGSRNDGRKAVIELYRKDPQAVGKAASDYITEQCRGLKRLSDGMIELTYPGFLDDFSFAAYIAAKHARTVGANGEDCRHEIAEAILGQFVAPFSSFMPDGPRTGGKSVDWREWPGILLESNRFISLEELDAHLEKLAQERVEYKDVYRYDSNADVKARAPALVERIKQSVGNDKPFIAGLLDWRAEHFICMVIRNGEACILDSRSKSGHVGSAVQAFLGYTDVGLANVGLVADELQRFLPNGCAIPGIELHQWLCEHGEIGSGKEGLQAAVRRFADDFKGRKSDSLEALNTARRLEVFFSFIEKLSPVVKTNPLEGDAAAAHGSQPGRGEDRADNARIEIEAVA